MPKTRPQGTGLAPVHAKGRDAAARATIRDVAEAAGVSINTVSRVINHHPDASSAARTNVERVVARLGYTPNRVARSLVSRRSRTIGMVVSDCTNPNTAQQIRAVQHVLDAAGYAMMIFDTQEDLERQTRALGILDDHMVDGIILQASEFSETRLRSLTLHAPVVLLNRTVAGLECDAVLNDNVEGARAATAHLIANGHRRIACLAANRQISTVADRLRGYRHALQAANIAYDPQLVIHTAVGVQPAQAAASALLALDTPPTAVFAYNDLVAVGVMAAAKDAGLHIPDQLAVIGFDNIEYARHLHVPMSTIGQQTQAMGEAAARRLLDRIQGDATPAREIRFSTSLIVRQSSGGSA